MMPSTYNAFRHRSTGAVAAYKRAVLSLLGILAIAYVLRGELWARFVRAPGGIVVGPHPIPGAVSMGYPAIPLSPSGRRAQERFFAEMREFWMWPHEYLLYRAQFEPILAFLVIGAVVAVVARYGRPFRAWLNDARRA